MLSVGARNILRVYSVTVNELSVFPHMMTSRNCEDGNKTLDSTTLLEALYSAKVRGVNLVRATLCGAIVCGELAKS